MKTFSYDTIENKIEFLTAILDVLKMPGAHPWLCLIAAYDLPGCSPTSTNLEYEKFIQNQLIEDGKLTPEQMEVGTAGFDFDVKVTEETYSIRIKYLQDKIAFFQDQLSQQKETKMEYQFKIGDSFKIKPEYQHIAPDQLGNVITIVDFKKWGGKPAYSGSTGGIFCEHEIELVKKAKHIPIGRKYQKTIDTSGWNNDQFNGLHRGQWVSNFGATGQFLGITARGTVTVNYKQTRDLKKQYAANQPLRKFVILHGGK